MALVYYVFQAGCLTSFPFSFIKKGKPSPLRSAIPKVFVGRRGSCGNSDQTFGETEVPWKTLGMVWWGPLNYQPPLIHLISHGYIYYIYIPFKMAPRGLNSLGAPIPRGPHHFLYDSYEILGSLGSENIEHERMSIQKDIQTGCFFQSPSKRWKSCWVTAPKKCWWKSLMVYMIVANGLEGFLLTFRYGLSCESCFFVTKNMFFRYIVCTPRPLPAVFGIHWVASTWECPSVQHGKKCLPPGDSLWPFFALFGGHLT